MRTNNDKQLRNLNKEKQQNIRLNYNNKQEKTPII